MKNPLSHKNFSASRFNPHGSVNVWSEGNVAYIDLAGPFNREFFSSMLDLSDSLYAELNSMGPFVEIAIFRDSILMPSDALSEFGDVLLKRKARGRAPLATAWVTDPSVEGTYIILPLAEEKFAQAKRPFKVFETLAEAETWVRGYLGSFAPQKS